MTALYIKANGEKIEVTPHNGVHFSLKELQTFVGGYIEMVLTKDQQTMVVNEEGRLNNLPVNHQASAMVTYGPILGDVLVCDWSMID